MKTESPRIVPVYLIEGYDRAGKDTLAKKLRDHGFVNNLHVNNFYECSVSDHFYDVSRTMFKTSSVASEVGSAMALVELMQIFCYSIRTGHYPIAVARSFISTAVFNSMRNSAFDDTTVKRMISAFERENNIKLEFRYILLTVSKEKMIERGSELCSFEIKNYDVIKTGFEFAIKTRGDILVDGITIDTSEKSIIEVFNIAVEYISKRGQK